MLEVCFSDSVKAAIRVAQIVDKNSIIGGASSVTIIGRSRLWMLLHPLRVRREKMRYERERQELRELMVPLESSREDIFGIDLFLDIGDIRSEMVFSDCPRKKVISDMLTADPWGELPDMEAEVDLFWGSSLNDLEKLKEKTTKDETVRVWVDDSPASMCGIMQIAKILLDGGCKVILAKAPKSFIRPDGVVIEYRGWGEIPPELYGKFTEVSEALSSEDLAAMAKGWETLKKRNAPLRVVENKAIKSAEADYYDETILGFLKGEMRVGELIGKALGDGKLLVSDWLIAERIKALIKIGKILMVKEEPSRFYGSAIQKA